MTHSQRVPILVYHHVYPEETPDLQQATFATGAGIIGAALFRRQMRYIAERGWTVVSTSQIVDWLRKKTTLPPKAVALHFDNGWLDTATVALPILRQFNFAATCFPITDGVEAAAAGKSAAVRTLTEGVIEKPFMNWAQAQQLLDAGWEIGAHTATHCKIADQHAAEGDEGVIAEAQMANEFFVRHLGFAPEHFAYPSGSRTQRTDELLSTYYRSLRLWHFEWPIRWTFTDSTTSLLAIDCQNIDLRVPFEDFSFIFSETAETA
jgi:peptidoglycan/xylan/chitin deacetylase (PgdA/CDA1 family)